MSSRKKACSFHENADNIITGHNVVQPNLLRLGEELGRFALQGVSQKLRELDVLKLDDGASEAMDGFTQTSAYLK